MRRAAAVDANQAQIVADLRAMGCSVQPLHGVGGGCPDLLVGYRGPIGTPPSAAFGINVLIEVKDGAKPPSARRLTFDQLDWHGRWRGQVAVATSAEDAMQIVDELWRETRRET